MIILGLGSNLEPRAQYIKSAIALLTRGPTPVLRNHKVSRIYETQALLPEKAKKNWDQPFLNCAIRGETSLSPKDLLKRINAIESEIGRKRNKRWEPRNIDIDILAYDTQNIEFDAVRIPHKELLNRDFCYLPFHELWKDWWIPSSLKSKFDTLDDFVQNQPSEINPTDRHDIELFFPSLMGIINLTPDSFSDGGDIFETKDAIDRALKLVNQGANILDLGAESTRPNAKPISSEEEWSRLKDPLFGIRSELPKTTISVDTRHPQTAKKAISMNVDWINDVSGLNDPEMIEVLKDFDGKIVFMHNYGVPADSSKTIEANIDPVQEVSDWAQDKISFLCDTHGFKKKNLIFDPGIGFGKTASQSLTLLKNLARFDSLGVEILVGHSRKSFLSSFTDIEFKDRDPHTAFLSTLIANHSVDYLRVHNVELHRSIFKLKSSYES